MAKITVVIEDNPNGTVSFHFHGDLPTRERPLDLNTLTGAQAAALTIYDIYINPMKAIEAFKLKGYDIIKELKQEDEKNGGKKESSTEKEHTGD